MDREPIAIIGIGCRFPGAKDPEAFWQLLRDGVDAITEVPANRWDIESFYDPDPAQSDKMNTRWGGFLDQVDQFDPQFFGIAPREATSMDPQQRLLLEVTWEALEDAGQIPDRLAGTRTGVFIGTSSHDYSVLIWGGTTDPYATTGTGNCIAANRISYLLDLHGPSLAVDTSCSSSLVAIHLACQSLWSGESTLALAGGVQVMLSPQVTVSFANAGFMAPDGRCKAFDSRANGYVRSEGAGVIVLKPLSQAKASGDPIYAVIRGSAVNQDGHSNGLTAPNPWAQEAVIREAYRQAGVSPGRVQYVEAHGTGTNLGDPIEMKALGKVLGEDRPSGQHCAVGSVKTNIGHAEAAAGIAGLIKVALSLKNRQIPPSLHFQEPNRYIPFDKLPLFVQQTLEPWPEGAGTALAGVSSFGFGGTNAHVVLEEAPAVKRAEGVGGVSQVPKLCRPLHLLTLSAKSENALRELTQRYEEFLAKHPEVSLPDVCFTANTGRSHFNHRLAIAAESTVQLQGALGDFALGKQTAGLSCGQVQSRKRPRIAFLFTGQGSQYVGMGRQLYEQAPTFRQTLDRCDKILRPYLEKPLLSVLYPESDATSPLDQTAYTQPALFALEYALAELWKSWGIQPDVVMGHSVGEYVAACVAGVFSLEDGLKLIALRARLMQALPQDGEMVAVLASEARVTAAIQAVAGKMSAPQSVAIATINGPENIVISGQRDCVRAVCVALEAEGVKTKKLQVSHAFHSPLMESMLADFERVASSVTFSSPRIGLISNVTGQLATAQIATPEYWLSHVLKPVKFEKGMETLHQQGYSVFVEIGPKPTLLGMGRTCLPEGVGVWLPSLRQGEQDWQQMLQSLGELYVYGVPVDWSAFDRDYPRGRVVLPTYPFQRQRYWFETSENGHQKAGSLFQEKAQTPIVNLLNKGDTEQLAQELEKAGNFSEAQMKLLPELLSVLVRQHQQHLLDKSDVVFDYYNSLSKNSPGVNDDSLENRSEERYLTFGPFPEVVPGFSWILTQADPQKYQEHVQLALNAQKEMRDVLFTKVDFSSCAKVLDFGCGYGSDLIALAEKYEHLELSGYTIASEQAKIATRKVHDRHLQDRIRIFNRDSSKDEFPDQYDLVFGFEVAHHIKNKHALFSNVGKHLGDSSFLVLADFISNTAFPIEHHETSSYFITKEEWVEQLSENHLKVIDCIDVSHEVANFLYDPNFQENLDSIYQINQDDNIRAAFQSYNQLGKLFRNGLASYVLLTAQKQSHLSKDEIYQLNQESLSKLVSYSERSLKQSLYELEWQPAAQLEPTLEKSQETGPGSWLIFADLGGVGQALVELLEGRGESCVLVSQGEAYEIVEAGHWRIDHTNPKHFQQLFHEVLRTSGRQCRGVVHLWSLDTVLAEDLTISSLKEAQAQGCGSVLHLVQALAQVESEFPRLWLVTRGAQAVGQAQATVQVQQAPLWGLGRVIALEHPDFNCVRLDLEPSGEADEIQALFEELWSPDKEDQIAYRQGVRHVARLVRRPSQASFHQPLIHKNSSYLIAGGLGALGLKVAHWMVEQGARHLVLIERRETTSVAQEAVSQLEQTGAQVLVVKADISNQEDVVRVLEEVKSSMPPLRGIIHAAGVLDSAVLLQQDWECFTRVMTPKVEGSWNLHVLTQDMPLDFFVCFSSVASLLGSPGQGNYAAANAFKDALAHHRSRLGLPALSINWGPWAEAGMAAELDNRIKRRIADLGLGSIDPEQGLEVLAELLGQHAAQVGVLPINWSQFLQQFPTGRKPPLFSEFAHQVGQQVEGEQPQALQLEILRQSEESSPGDRHELLIAYLQEQVAKALGLSASPLDVQQPLNDMGLDSLMALDLKNRVKTDLLVDVPVVKFMEGFSVASLAVQVIKQLTEAQSNQSVSLATAVTQIGMNKGVHPEDSGRLSRGAISDSDWTEGEL